MTTRALVLGGGGTVGIAWETGVLNGLHRAGIDIGAADLIVGTSAGSVVGTQLALGMPLDALLAMQLAPLGEAENQPFSFDQQVFGTVVARLSQPERGGGMLADVGALALSASTISEQQYLERFALLAELPWPERSLQITAVETTSGEFQVWDRTSGAPLATAVASSCAVPGIFPPVTINGRRYMDGGMRSDTNADLARGYDTVLIVRPINTPATGMGSGANNLDAEIAGLRSAGSRVELIAPDAAAQAVFGINLMDTTRRGGAAQEGLRQAEAAAEAIRALWEQR